MEESQGETEFTLDQATGLYLPPIQSSELDPTESAKLKDLLISAQFDQAEQIARKLQANTRPGTPEAASAAHLLARALYANNKLPEAAVYTDLAKEIRYLRSTPLDLEGILLEILSAQLLEQSGELDRSISLLDKVIEQCMQPSLVPHIHIPVILKCLQLVKLDRFDELQTLLQDVLPIMQESPDASYREELRELWVAIAEKKEDISPIVRLILSSEVSDLINEKVPSNFEGWVPPGWAEDSLSNFLQVAENNTLAAFQDYPYQFNILSNIEARLRLTALKSKEIFLLTAYQRLGADLAFDTIEPSDWLETFFVMRAHSAFLGAIRLAMSAHYAETNMVLRGALENAMYCFAITAEQTLRQVWFDKYKDASSTRRFKHRFSIASIAELMTKANQIVNDECARLYEQLIDLGGHPNEPTFSTLGISEVTQTHLSLSVPTLQPDLSAPLLDTTIDVGILMLELLALALPRCTAAAPFVSVDHSDVALRAYHRWLNRGCSHGFDEIDWFRAEAEIRLMALAQ
ncbi:MAG: DUF2934 domain-containing protein [Candidatus Melainabacteria bacterium]|nr:DUF2934 domain-containing protein [Candidatus Melainabacteria bacterium]